MVDFAIERLSSAQPDIDRLAPMQWDETGDREIDCKPNWPLYRQLNERNVLLVVVARQDSTAVGYLFAFIYPHPNAVEYLKAEIPTYFVKKGPNRALILNRMVDFALERLAERDVFKIEIQTHAEHSAGRLWELKGFKMSKIGYTLKLKSLPEVKYA